MKKTGKSILTLVILLIVLTGLIAGYLILRHFNTIETEEEDTSITLLDKSDKTVTSLRYSNGETDLSFVYKNDVWEYALDSHFPLQQEALQSMAAAASSVTAKMQVDTKNKGDETYGLTAPSLTVEVTFSDESTYTYLFGDTNSFNGYQYFLLSGDSAIYMVDASLAKSFGSPLNTLFQKETYLLLNQGVQASDITSILLETNAGAAKEITDTSGIEALFKHVDTLNLNDWIDYYADSTEMQESYGIHENSDRITVTYTKNGESSTYTVYIGNKFERITDQEDSDASDPASGSEYFYSPEGSSVVYTTDEATVDAIFDYLAYTPDASDTSEDA